MTFIDDYDDIENYGVGAGNNKLLFGSKFLKRDIALRKKDQWKPKTLDELDQESRDIYKKMGNFIRKKRIDEEFCLTLVNHDLHRDGYINKIYINEAMVKHGMKVNTRQLDLLTQELSLGADD